MRFATVMILFAAFGIAGDELRGPRRDVHYMVDLVPGGGMNLVFDSDFLKTIDSKVLWKITREIDEKVKAADLTSIKDSVISFATPRDVDAEAIARQVITILRRHTKYNFIPQTSSPIIRPRKEDKS